MTLSTIKIVGVIEGVSTINNKTPIEAIFYYLKVSGCKYVYLQITKLLIISMLKVICSVLDLKNSIYYPYEKDNKYIIIRTKNINSSVIVDTIKKLKPDIILSLFTGLIFKEEILNLPAKGCINVHPSLLPQYRGVSPIFWALLNNDEEKIGVTVHYMTNEIDAGKVIFQKKIKIPFCITEHALYLEAISVAFGMLKEFFGGNYKYGKPEITSDTNIQSHYYSFPTKAAVSLFRKNKKNFYSLRELIFSRYTYDSLFEK